MGVAAGTTPGRKKATLICQGVGTGGGVWWARDGVGIRLAAMLFLRPHCHAVTLVSLLWTLLASVQVLEGCEEPLPGVGAAVSATAESSGPVDACACLCACGCAGTVVALLPGVPVRDKPHLVGPRRVTFEVTPPTVAGPAPPTEPPRG